MQVTRLSPRKFDVVLDEGLVPPVIAGASGTLSLVDGSNHVLATTTLRRLGSSSHYRAMLQPGAYDAATKLRVQLLPVGTPSREFDLTSVPDARG